MSFIHCLNTLLYQTPRHSLKPFSGAATITLNNLVKSTLKKPARDHGFHVRHAPRLPKLFRLSTVGSVQ